MWDGTRATEEGGGPELSDWVTITVVSRGEVCMAKSEGCPQCGSRQVDEYTHNACQPGSTPEDHRHWVCANSACNHEWVETLSE